MICILWNEQETCHQEWHSTIIGMRPCWTRLYHVRYLILDTYTWYLTFFHMSHHSETISYSILDETRQYLTIIGIRLESMRLDHTSYLTVLDHTWHASILDHRQCLRRVHTWHSILADTWSHSILDTWYLMLDNIWQYSIFNTGYYYMRLGTRWYSILDTRFSTIINRTPYSMTLDHVGYSMLDTRQYSTIVNDTWHSSTWYHAWWYVIRDTWYLVLDETGPYLIRDHTGWHSTIRESRPL